MVIILSPQFLASLYGFKAQVMMYLLVNPYNPCNPSWQSTQSTFGEIEVDPNVELMNPATFPWMLG